MRIYQEFTRVDIETDAGRGEIRLDRAGFLRESYNTNAIPVIREFSFELRADDPEAFKDFVALAGKATSVKITIELENSREV